MCLDGREHAANVFYYLHLFFFFQAEDGIRDGRVTGVQTCALPIWRRLRRAHGCSCRADLARVLTHRTSSFVVSTACSGIGGVASFTWDLPRRARRSEERRVGKECRSRWAAYD